MDWHWQWETAHSRRPPPRPAPLRRPWEAEGAGVEAGRPPLATRQQMAAFFGGTYDPNIAGLTGMSARYTPDPSVEGGPAPEPGPPAPPPPDLKLPPGWELRSE